MTKEEHKKVFDLIEEIMSRSMFSSSSVNWALSAKVDKLKEEMLPKEEEEKPDYTTTWSCC